MQYEPLKPRFVPRRIFEEVPVLDGVSFTRFGVPVYHMAKMPKS